MTLYNSWIGGKPDGFLPMAFYYLLPLFAVLPYSSSYFDETRTGYLRQVLIKVKRNQFIIVRYFSTFVSGFLVIAVPLVLNFLFVACFVPARIPDVVESLYYGVYKGQLFSNWYYNTPLLYAAFYILLPSIFAGLWATVPLVLSFYVKTICKF